MELYKIIECSDMDDLLVFKHPCEDFNTASKLIVRESQQAVFVKNGQICDVFSAGRYVLKTENIPILSKLVNIATKGETSFSAEVYFFDVRDVLNIKWGTATPIEIQDPIYKIILKMGASGEMTFKITNPSEFLRKISGTKTTLDKEGLKIYFRSLVSTYIKNAISESINKNKISFLEINSRLLELSKSTNEFINTKLEDYGLLAKNLTVENIVIPEEELKQLKQALNQKAEMDIVGYTYGQKRSFDVMQGMAENESAGGSFGTALMGLGAGLGVAGGVAKTVGDITENLKPNTKQTKQCPKCGAFCSAESKFCSECGSRLDNVSTKFCKYCGESIPINSKFCPICGKELKDEK